MEVSVSLAYPDDTGKDLPIHPRAGCVQGKEEGDTTGEAYAEGRELTFLGRTRFTLLDPCSVSLLQMGKLRLRNVFMITPQTYLGAEVGCESGFAVACLPNCGEQMKNLVSLSLHSFLPPFIVL